MELHQSSEILAESNVETSDGQRKVSCLRQWALRLLGIASVLTVIVFILVWFLLPRSSVAPSPGHLTQVTPAGHSTQVTPAGHSTPVTPAGQLTPVIPAGYSVSPAVETCQSEACIRASALLLGNIDLSADPCKDFYSFSCGGLMKRPYGPETISRGVNIVSEESKFLESKLFDLFYNADLAASGDPETDQMHQVVRGIFLSCIGWASPNTWWLRDKPNQLWNHSRQVMEPLLQPIDQASSLEQFLATLVKAQISGLIQQTIGITYNQLESLRLAKLKGPVLFFQTLKFQFASVWDAKVALAVYRFKLVFSKLFSNTSSAGTIVAVQNTLYAFANAEFPARSFQGTLQQLQSDSDALLDDSVHFNWTSFITHLYEGPINDQLTIVVTRFKDFMKVLNLLAPDYIARQGVLYDIIRFDAAMSMGNILPKETFGALRAAYAADKFEALPSAEATSESRMSFCLRMPVASMGPVVYDMFKRAYMTDNFTLIDSLVNQLQNAMTQNANDAEWISDRSKLAIKRKIENMHRVISYYEMSALEIKYLFRLTIGKFAKAQSFGDIILMQQEAKFRQTLWFFTSQASEFDAFAVLSQPFEINAFYTPYFNGLDVKAGLIGTYLYHQHYPEYLLYGFIGTVIGHEIAHGFGPTGILFNEHGSYVRASIFDSETRMEYKRRSQCLVDSYSQMMLLPNSTTRVSGKGTVGENFADIVGINAAFRAYKEHQVRSGRSSQLLPGLGASGLSPDQLFFVQAAQFHCEKMEKKLLLLNYLTNAHSPPRARVLGAMLHSKDFSRVFQCKPGNLMYLTDSQKCQNW